MTGLLKTGLSQTLIATLSLWLHRARSRAQLRDLPPYMLADIGLDAAARDAECSQWAWHGRVLRISEPPAKENGRRLRAPVSNFISLDRV